MTYWISKVKKNKLIMICMMCFALLIKAMVTRLFDDFSQESQYHFFHIPITKQLAKNLSECKPYHRNYKYTFFQTIWIPYYKGTFSLSINPSQDDYCRISAKNSHYKFEYDIPVGLAKYVGNLMLNYCFSSKRDLTELKKFVSCVDENIHYSTGEQYIVDALRDIENYIAKWNTNDMKQIKDFRKQKLADEELNCRENLSNMQRNLKSKNIVRKKSYYEKKATFSECEFTLNSEGEILLYNFSPLPNNEIPNEYRIIQCWQTKFD